jgi:hypothetical protein
MGLLNKWTFFLFTGLLTAGIAGYFAFTGQWPRYLFAQGIWGRCLTL